jgi:hypothetical protein
MAEKKKTAAADSDAAPQATAQATTPRGLRVRFDTKNLRSSYANVCNATTTREEFVLNFGINHGPERAQGEVAVELQERIIMTPQSARRLAELMVRLVKEYEARYGAIVQEPRK